VEPLARLPGPPPVVGERQRSGRTGRYPQPRTLPVWAI
jgi:hypothetical protein